MLKDPKKLVLEMTADVGKHQTVKFLVDEGVSTSTADKLSTNRYESEVKELVRSAILRAYEAYKAS